eukprot:gene8083-8948_t
MPLVHDTDKAVEILEIFREKLKSKGDYGQENEIAAIVQMLDSPMFRQIITIQDSLKELQWKVKTTPNVGINDYDFSPTGELVFQPGMSTSSSQAEFGKDEVEGETPLWNHNDLDSLPGPPDYYNNDNNDIDLARHMNPGLMKSAYADDLELVRGLEATAEGREIDTIKLVKPELGGLGFSVVGLKSENRGELGIFVQGIQPGGVADRDGNLHEGDQILAINGQRIDTGLSHQDAIAILQKTRGNVELIIATGGMHRPSSDISRENSMAGSSFISRSNSGASSSSLASMPTGDGIHWRQIETIELYNSGSSLGFGIVGGKTSGVIVKTILPGGTADKDGRLKSGDSILQINDINLGGKGSDEVANILRKAGNKVKLVISRIVDEEPPKIPVRPDNDDYEVETFEVKLRKNEKGLGITIAGYVGEKSLDELSGIFIQNISEGSAAAQDGRLQLNDQIVEVDGQSLDGMNNLEAVEVLKNTGSIVSLIIARVKDKHQSMASSDVIGNDIATTLSAPAPDGLYFGSLPKDVEEELKDHYQELLGDGVDVYAIQFSKFHPSGGLGISLEGSTSIGDGSIFWHRIHSIYEEGPVGKVNVMKPGDFIVEINGTNVLNLPHSEVVSLIQGLPQHIRLVFARELEDNGFNDDDIQEFPRTLSMEISENHAEFSDDVKYVELIKGDRGLGFSILDYQLQDRTVIIIRSLVPGSPAALNGGLDPGDQLTSVNDVNLENASLDIAVQALKATPQGKIRIGVRKQILDISSRNDRDMESPTVEKIHVPDNATRQLPQTSLPSAVESDNEAVNDSADNAMEIATKVPVIITVEKSCEENSSSSSDESGDDNDSYDGHDLPVSTEDIEMSRELGANVRSVTIPRDVVGLGITLGDDKDGSGSPVLSVLENGTIIRDGSIKVSDRIVSINGEDLRNATSYQARGILRRTALQKEVNIKFISADATTTTATKALADVSLKSTKPAQSGIPESLLPVESPVIPAVQNDVTSITPPQDATGNQLPLATLSPVPSFDLQPVKTVELSRDPEWNLGISIVGGRSQDQLGGENKLKGIYIKHVLETSSAGKNGILRCGDQILQVDDVDLREASHEEAVAVIRNAKSPVKFVVRGMPMRANGAQDSSNLLPASRSDSDGSNSLQLKPTIEVTVSSSSDDSEHKRIFTDPYTARYPDFDGKIFEVELSKGKTGIGLSIAGGKGASSNHIFVVEVKEGGPAHVDGRIRAGDEILEVNNVQVRGLTHQDASAILRKAENTAKLVLGRPDDPSHFTSLAALHEQMNSPMTPPPPPRPQLIRMKTVRKEEIITLEKGPTGLGFAIGEGSRAQDGEQGIFIKNITEGGAAFKDSRLHVGDQLLAVNDHSLIGLGQAEAVNIIKSAEKSVTLLLAREIEVPVDEEPDAEDSEGSIGTLTPRAQIDAAEDDQQTVSSHTSEPERQSTPDIFTTIALGQADTSFEKDEAFTRVIEPGKEIAIKIRKGSNGLGLSIVGGSDTLLGAIIIHEVYEDGAAFDDGRLHAGDQLIKVNDVALVNASHSEAISALKSTGEVLELIVLRDSSHYDDDDSYEYVTVELEKPPGRGLGLSIVGRRNDTGVFISDVVAGSIAAASGKIMQGDQIILVNNQDLTTCTQEFAAKVLKGLLGHVTLKVCRLKSISRASSLRKSLDNRMESTSTQVSTLTRDAASLPDIEPGVRVVEIYKGPDDILGLGITGGLDGPSGDKPVTISYIKPGSASGRARLKIGDRILRMNGQPTDQLTHASALELLRQLNGPVTLHVLTPTNEKRPVSEAIHRSMENLDALATSSRKGNPPITQPLLTSTTAVTRLSQLSLHSSEAGSVVLNNRFPPTYSDATSKEEPNTRANVKEITLERGNEGLGFSVVGGYGSLHGDLPIYVKTVYEKGAASKDGRLKRGDQIIAVNGTSLEAVTHEMAVNILKKSKGLITLTVLCS